MKDEKVLMSKKKSELLWTTDLKKINKNNFSFEVIYENDTLKPWKLIFKN